MSVVPLLLGLGLFGLDWALDSHGRGPTQHNTGPAGAILLLGGLILLTPAARSRSTARYWISLVAAGSALIAMTLSSTANGAAGALAGVSQFLPAGIFLAIALGSVPTAVDSPRKRRQFAFQHVLAFLLFVASAVGVEVIAGALVPSWPARSLRPIPMSDRWAAAAGGDFNSWGMRDTEHSIEKPAGVKRVLFIGDSFLEGAFSRRALPGYVAENLTQVGRTDIVECINLGVSATGPAHYLSRLRDVGVQLDPDVVLLFVYAGNDFMRVSYENAQTPFIEELPIPSILGAVMPRLTWMLARSLGTSEIGRTQPATPDEFEQLREFAEQPYEAGIAALADYVHRYYFRHQDRAVLDAVLSDGGEAFWRELAPREVDRQYLFPYRVKQVVARGLRNRGLLRESVFKPATDKNKAQLVRATRSYVRQIAADLERAGIPLCVFLVPVATNVDPAFREFWEPWYGSDTDPGRAELRTRLHDALAADRFHVIDLATDLDGVPGTHRVFDKHWNEKGHQIVARRVTEVILDLVEG